MVDASRSDLRRAGARNVVVGHNPAVGQCDDPMCAAGEREVVRDEHKRGARLAVQVLHQLDHARPSLLVQVAGWLVREKDARPVGEGARERDPLLLAARELGGVVVEPTGQPDPVQQPGRALAQLARGAVAEELERHEHVLERGERGQQMKGLEDEADVLRTKLGALVLGKNGEVHSVEPHVPRGGLVEAGQQPEQRRLAAARRAQDRDEGLRGNAEIDVPQDGQRAAAARIRLPQPFGHDHMRVRSLVLVMALLAAPGCDPADDAGTSTEAASRPEESNGERAPASPRPAAGPRVVFMGTSLTAGFGLLSPEDSYTARLQELADSADLPARMVNAGVSGETSAGGLRRIPWVLGDTVDVLVLELGANDGLRGLDPDALAANLGAIIDSTRTRWPDAQIVLVGMEAPPNLGTRYARAFRDVFPRVARSRSAALVPFLLEGVGGVDELNQDDGIHPTAEGHARMARTVWPVLEPVLRELAPRP